MGATSAQAAQIESLLSAARNARRRHRERAQRLELWHRMRLGATTVPSSATAVGLVGETPQAWPVATAVAAAITAFLEIALYPMDRTRAREKAAGELKTLERTLEDGRATLSISDLRKLQFRHLEALTEP